MANRLFAVVMAVYLILDVLLTPFAGIETRTITNLTTTGYATLVLFIVGLILCAGSLLLTYYGAERFENLGLEGRLYNLWWVPLIGGTAIVGCRLMALNCWWF